MRWFLALAASALFVTSSGYAQHLGALTIPNGFSFIDEQLYPANLLPPWLANNRCYADSTQMSYFGGSNYIHDVNFKAKLDGSWKVLGIGVCENGGYGPGLTINVFTRSTPLEGQIIDPLGNTYPMVFQKRKTGYGNYVLIGATAYTTYATVPPTSPSYFMTGEWLFAVRTKDGSRTSAYVRQAIDFYFKQ